MRRYLILPVMAMHLASHTASGGNLGFDMPLSEPSTTQITLTGSAQSQDRIEGRVELMVPLDVDWLNSESLDSYGIVTGRAGKQGWQVGAGGGIRVTVDEDTTVGGYGIVEHQRSTLGHGFWRLSPGLELQWGPWRLSTNAYLPVGKNEVLLSSVFDPSTLEFSEFKGHTGTLKTPLSIEELKETGIKGVDIVGSWQINAPLRVSVGGYYLTHEAEALAGIVAGAGYQVQPGVTLEVQGRRDAKEAELRAQVSIQFGNLNTSHQNNALQRVGADWATPGTVVSQSKSKITTLENLYFYKQNGTGSACTAESPCGTIVQEEVDRMPAHSMLLLAHPATDFSYKIKDSKHQDLSILTFKNSQSILGRSADFKQTSTKNSTIQSALKIQGGLNIVVDRIQLLPDPNGEIDYGIWIHQAQHVLVNNIQIDVTKNNQRNEISKAIKIDSSAHVKVFGADISSSTVGLDIMKSREVEIEAVINKVRGGTHVFGLFVDSGTTAFKINKSQFSVTSPYAAYNLVGMSGIEGVERKAEHNKFNFSLCQGAKKTDAVVTTNLNGPDEKQIADKDTVTDRWGNQFTRNDDRRRSSTFIEQLWEKVSRPDAAITQIK